MDKYPIKITIKTGTLIVYSKRPKPHVGQCTRCKQKIYFVKTMYQKKILISLVDEEYVSHFLVCPALKRKRKKKK